MVSDMKYKGLDIEYNEKSDNLVVDYDVDDDGEPDIKLTVKLKFLIRKYIKEEAIVAAAITIIGVLKYLNII